MKRHPRGDAGASLILALVFITVISAVLLPVAGLVTASLSSTSLTKERVNAFYASEGGAQYGVDAVRRDLTACNTTGAHKDYAPLSLNGLSVAVSCDYISGGGLGASTDALDYAVVVTDLNTPATNLLTTGGGSIGATGPVYLGRSTATNEVKSQLVIGGGDLYVNGGAGCPLPPDIEVTVAPTFNKYCTSTSPSTLLAGTVIQPDTIPVIAPSGSTLIGSCRVWYPGRYGAATADDLVNTSGDNYFASGPYRLDNAAIVGPQNGVRIYDKDAAASSGSACASVSDQDARDAATASGNASLIAAAATISGVNAQMVLTGNTSLQLQGGEVRLSPRSRAGSPDLSTLNLIALRTTQGGYPVSTAATALSVNTGNSFLSLRGGLWAPGSAVDLSNAGANSSISVQSGFVVGSVALKKSAQVSGTAQFTTRPPGAGNRLVRVTSVSSGAGNRGTTTRADIRVISDAGRTTTVQSWRSTD